MIVISTLNTNNVYRQLKNSKLIIQKDYLYKKKSYLFKFCRYNLYFMLYSFIGWIWEELFILILDGEFQQRGFLHIPICSIYGFGILMILFLFYKKNYHWIIIFFCSALVTCLIEFLTSWEMEKLFHRIWWDYSGWIFNLQGRISLLTSLAFGIVSVFVVNWIHPLSCEVLDKYFRKEICLKLSLVLFTITIIDFVITTLMLL